LATLVVAVVVLAFGLAACGGDGAGGSTPTATVTVTATPTVEPTGEPGATMTVSLYFLRGETLGVAHRAVPATGAPATAAMNVLLAGPDTRERAAGLGTTIPDGVVLHGIVIDSETKIATVDLGDRFAAGDGALSLRARVAEVVYTLTQFPTVRSVRFLIDGEPDVPLGGEGLLLEKPQTRAGNRDLLPAIFVESPAVGDVISDPRLTLRGSASVFEATFVAEVLDTTGEVVADKTVTARVGAPGRGGFVTRVSLPMLTGKGKLVVYEVSMADGSRMNEVRIPLRFAIQD
jgi:hypothetical protein